MDPKDFLNVAEYLLDNNPTEAALRSVVSRSYYAVHIFMSQFLQREDIDIYGDLKRHKKVYQLLHNCGNQTVMRIAEQLHDLLGDRNNADYDMDDVSFNEKNKALFAYLKASTAFKDFQEAISSRKKRAQITKGINKYLETTGRPK